jgi:hypothetical protein
VIAVAHGESLPTGEAAAFMMTGSEFRKGFGLARTLFRLKNLPEK